MPAPTCAWCGHANDLTVPWCPMCGHAAHLPRGACACAACQPPPVARCPRCGSAMDATNPPQRIRDPSDLVPDAQDIRCTRCWVQALDEQRRLG